jgi:hypothetical protein
VYTHLLETCGKSTSGFSQVATNLIESQGFLRELPGSPLFTVADAQSFEHWSEGQGRLGVLETLDDRFGKVGRVVAIVALAIALAALVVLTLTMAEAMSSLYLATKSPNAN